MKVSSAAAEAATNNGHHTNSSALQQLTEAIAADADPGGEPGSDTATAVLEEGEEEDASEDEEFVGIGQPGLKPGEIALVGVEFEPHPDDSPEFVAAHTESAESSEANNGKPANVQTVVGIVPAVVPVAAATSPAAVPAAPAPYDPIAEVDEEITENNERIVAHAIRASELDTMLKATKKSLKTAADEGVELAVRRAGLLLQQKEKAEREAAAASKPERPAQPALDAVLKPADDSALNATPEQIAAHVMPQAADGATESTEDFHARIAEQFAPDPAASLTPTPEQERYDHEFRSLAIEGLEGLTPKICEILQANQIFTVGAFQDWPKKTGCEYTQMSGGNAKLTEVRYEKIMDAMTKYLQNNPRPSAAVAEAAVSAEVAPAVPATSAAPAGAPTSTLDIDDI